MPAKKQSTSKRSSRVVISDESEEEKPVKPTRGKRTTAKKTSSEKGSAAKDDGKKSDVKVTQRKVSGTYRPKWLGEQRDPPKHGSKPIPVGKPDCLKGLIFVLTGLNESMTRDETTDLITRYGGIERSAVSGKTNYLVAGFEMEDGRPITSGSKYKKALEKNVKIINEDELLNMIRASNPEASAANEAEQLKAMKKQEENAVANEGLLMKNHVSVDSDLLTTKYAPSSIEEIIGNKTIVDNVKQWLTDWDDVFIHKKLVVKHTSQNPDAKAVLLSGPPGIGKTTSAHVVAKECGFGVLELNASDCRNRKTIKALLQDAVQSHCVSQHYTTKGSNQQQKQVVIMDEVDGMGSGDRGGIAELISVIDSSQIPIICICNDRESPKIRSLAKHCYDCSFGKLPKDAVINRLLYICSKENLDISKDALSDLVEESNGDMRQCLNKLQYFKLHSSTAVQSALPHIRADTLESQTAFQVAKKLLTESSKYSFQDRYSLFFNDYSLTPLVIEENYINSIASKHYDDQTLFNVLTEAADAMCTIEYVNSRIMQSNNWKLLPVLSAMNLRACDFASGSFVMTKFPLFFGNLSKQRKNKQLLIDLASHIQSHVTCRKRDLILDGCEVLNEYIMKPLKNDDPFEAVSRLDEYEMTPEDLTEGLNRILLEKDTTYDSLPGKTKRSLTSAWKQQSHLQSNVFTKAEDLWEQKSRKRGAAAAKTKSKKVKVEESSSDESVDLTFDLV